MERVVTQECDAERHAATKYAYIHGCRCPGALAAHDQYRARRRRSDTAWRLSIRNPDPTCPAERHRRSEEGWQGGCRCTGAVAAHNKAVRGRGRRAAAGLAELTAERDRWRGPDSRVNRISLMFLIDGYPDTDAQGRTINTPAEIMVAVMRLSHRRYQLDLKGIAARVGLATPTVYHYLGKPARLRGERALRRLADAQWRAARLNGQGPLGH